MRFEKKRVSNSIVFVRKKNNGRNGKNLGKLFIEASNVKLGPKTLIYGINEHIKAHLLKNRNLMIYHMMKYRKCKILNL